MRRQHDLDAAFAALPGKRRSGGPIVLAVASAGCLAAVAVPYAATDHPVRREAQQSPGPSAPTGNPSTVRAMSARQALLGAAAAAWQLPATTGAYWHTNGMYVTVNRVLEDSYLVEVRQHEEKWTAGKPGRTSWWITGHLGARPLGGAPGSDRTFWTVPLDLKCIDKQTKAVRPCRQTMRIDAKPGKASASPLNAGDKVFDLAGRNMSVADLRRLPSDPKRLKAHLLSTYEGHSTESDDAMDQTTWLYPSPQAWSPTRR